MSVWDVALATIRQRKAGFAAVFVAVLGGSTLVTALGVLLESGLRAGVPPQRYAAAAVVVGGAQAFPLAEDIDPYFSERVPLPASAVGKIAAVAGAGRAVGDVSVPVELVPVGGSAVGHGWSSAALTPFGLRQGKPPNKANEVVLDAELRDAPASASVTASTSPSPPVTHDVPSLASPLRRVRTGWADSRCCSSPTARPGACPAAPARWTPSACSPAPVSILLRLPSGSAARCPARRS